MTSFYYNEKGQVFLSKFDAIAKSDLLFLYYYDEEFKKFDWTKKPEESLEFLYKERAQQLRDSYEKIIIAYSGGVDSTNVLETFYYNNIHVDEILMVGAFSQDNKFGSDENHNAEIYYNCLKTLKKFNLKNTKIIFEDYSLKLLDKNNFSLSKIDDWYRWIGSRYPLHSWHWYDADYRMLNSKKTALIFGIDKPMIEYDFLLNKTFFRFIDGAIFQYGQTPERVCTESNFKRINFYWDPLATKLLIKQMHVVKEFLEKHVISIEKNETAYYEYFIKNNEKIISNIIYNLKNPLSYVSPKSNSKFFSLRDNFVLKKSGFKDLDVYKCFEQGQNIINPRRLIKNNKYTKNVYSETIYSKKYYLS